MPPSALGFGAEPESSDEHAVSIAPDLLKLAEFLGNADLFHELTPGQNLQLARLAELRRCTAGQVIFEQGSIGTELYVVRTGEVRLCDPQIDPTHPDFTLTFGPGDCFGELSLIDGSPRIASAIAGRETELIVFPQDELDQLLVREKDASISVMVSLLRLLTQRLRKTTDDLRHAVRGRSD